MTEPEIREQERARCVQAIERRIAQIRVGMDGDEAAIHGLLVAVDVIEVMES